MGVDDFRTYAFKQGEILEMMQGAVEGTSAAKGICQELCWKWMKRLRNKAGAYSSPKARMDAMWKDSTVNKAIAHHNSATLLNVPQDFYNIPKNNYQSAWGYSKDTINRWRMQGGGLFIAVFCPKYKNEKHAVSFYIPTPVGAVDSTVLFFDSNHGEYSMKFGDVYKFLPDFLMEKYQATLENIAELVAYGTPGQVGKV